MKEIEKQNRVDRSKNKIEGLAKDSFLEHLPQTFWLGQELDHVFKLLEGGSLAFFCCNQTWKPHFSY